MNQRAERAIADIASQLGVPVMCLDTRHINSQERDKVLEIFQNPGKFLSKLLAIRTGWRIEPLPGWLEWNIFGPIIALFLLFFPAITTVFLANYFAGWLDPLITNAVQPLVEGIRPICGPLVSAIMIGDYGLITMGPKLFVWAVPTVIFYAFLIAIYKASGWADRINAAIHPLIRPIGLNGRDVLRVVMGFGCNVPAVIHTRSCSSCTRGTAISAIAFGSACSYQLPDTLAVFAAAGKSSYSWLYLGYLLLTTLIYTRLVSNPKGRSAENRLILTKRTFLEWPNLSAVWREARQTLTHFFASALPIFLLITLIASLLLYSGSLTILTNLLEPFMKLFRLPAESAMPIALASIRKDGILLFMNSSVDKLTNPLTGLQLLTGVYLAGVLFPCLVTTWTIAREQGFAFALRLVLRQAFAAILFSMILAWSAYYLGF